MSRHKKYSREEADALLEAAGYTPEELYPGNVRMAWGVTCNECKRPRKVRLADIIAKGIRCRHGRLGRPMVAPDLPMDEIVAKYGPMSVRELAKEYGISFGTMYRRLGAVTKLQPPGGNTRSAAARASKRGLERVPSLKKRKKHSKYTPKEAYTLLRKAGYIQTEPYPGNVSVVWSVTCAACKKPRRITLAEILKGIRCKHRGAGWPLDRLSLPMDEIVPKYHAYMTIRELAEEYSVSFGTMQRRLQAVTQLRYRGQRFIRQPPT